MSLVKSPFPVKAALAYILVPEATPAVKLYVLNAIDLVNDKVPASTFILAAPVKEIIPGNVFDPVIFLIAPSLLIPVPVIDIFSSANVTPP